MQTQEDVVVQPAAQPEAIAASAPVAEAPAVDASTETDNDDVVEDTLVDDAAEAIGVVMDGSLTQLHEKYGERIAALGEDKIDLQALTTDLVSAMDKVIGNVLDKAEKAIEAKKYSDDIDAADAEYARHLAEYNRNVYSPEGAEKAP